MKFNQAITGIVCLGALAAAAAAQTAPGSIINIEGALHGDWTLTQQAFIPSSSDSAHFGLDTLAVFESVPAAIVPLRGEIGGGRPAEHWDDLWITVTRSPGADTDAMIAVDKEVLNLTEAHWTDFHMELLPLTSGAQPTFKTDPPPLEETGAFPNPPMYGPAPGTPVTELWWLQDDTTKGVDYGGISLYWVGINVPLSAFTQTPNGDVAMFVLRQHWTPSPGATGVMSLAGLAALRRRRRLA